MEKFTIVSVDVKGVLICDKSGLVLTSKIKKNFSFSYSHLITFFLVVVGKIVLYPTGSIARLAELAGSLSGRRTTVCLENQEKSVEIFSFNSFSFLLF